MHHAAWVLAPLLLVLVLVWSGTAKAGKGTSLQSIIRNLRLPAWLLPTPLARAVPWIEIALAVALLSPWLPLYAVAAAVTLGLMVTYWLLIARGLTLRPRPTCGCFGQAGDHQISGRTLARNTLLVAAGVAALALAVSGRTVWSLVSDFGWGQWLWLLLSAAVACCVAIIVAPSPVAQHTRTTRSPGSADAKAGSGTDAPVTDPFGEEVADDDYVRAAFPTAVVVDAGTPVTLHELAATRAQLLVFIDCYCQSTQDIARDIPGWVERMPAIDVRLVCSMPHDAGSPVGPVDNLLLDRARLTWEALELEYSPSAVLLGADGFLAGGPVSGVEAVREFAADIEAQLTEAGAMDAAVADVDTTTDTRSQAETEAETKTGAETKAETKAPTPQPADRP